jgi:nucleoside-triphosphatase THEP1
MELCSNAFQEAVLSCMNSKKPILGTIHYTARYPLINVIKTSAEIIEVTPENRVQLQPVFNQKVLQLMQSK